MNVRAYCNDRRGVLTARDVFLKCECFLSSLFLGGGRKEMNE